VISSLNLHIALSSPAALRTAEGFFNHAVSLKSFIASQCGDRCMKGVSIFFILRVHCSNGILVRVKRNLRHRKASPAPALSPSMSFCFFYFCSMGFGQGLWISLRIQLYLSDSGGPVELKRATLGSEDRPRVGGGPEVGSPGPKKEPGRGARTAAVGSQGWPCSYISRSYGIHSNKIHS
jgi:hypothetical protein